MALRPTTDNAAASRQTPLLLLRGFSIALPVQLQSLRRTVLLSDHGTDASCELANFKELSDGFRPGEVEEEVAVSGSGNWTFSGRLPIG